MDEKASAHRLPGLDGLRAISIGLVLAYHLQMEQAIPRRLHLVLEHGRFGVEIFFVISGLLITWLLLREEARHGTISLRQFYARRAVRILPPAVVYLLVIGAASLAVGQMDWKHWLSALCFVRNFDMADATQRGVVNTSHFWSLSSEEQFYLLWPVTFMLLPRTWRAPLLAVLLLLLPPWRHHLMSHSNGPVPVFRLDYHSDGIIAGCLMACLMEDHRLKRLFAHPIWRSDWIVLAGIGVIAVTFLFEDLNKPGQVAYPTVQAIAVAVILLRVIRRTGDSLSPLDWFLNQRWLVWLGQVSYGLYLWQQPFCMPNGIFRTPWRVSDLLAAVACTAASWFLIERPSQRLRRWLGSRTAGAVPSDPVATAPEAPVVPASAIPPV